MLHYQLQCLLPVQGSYDEKKSAFSHLSLVPLTTHSKPENKVAKVIKYSALERMFVKYEVLSLLFKNAVLDYIKMKCIFDCKQLHNFCKSFTIIVISKTIFINPHSKTH